MHTYHPQGSLTSKEHIFVFTALTVGVWNDADIPIQTCDPALPSSKERTTPMPDKQNGDQQPNP